MTFKGFPAVAARLRSAAVKLWSVSRCREVDSWADKSGTICGVSGFPVGALGFVGGATPRGLMGAGGVRMESGGGGGGTSRSISGAGTSTTSAGEGCCGCTGRTSTAVLQGMEGFFRAAQPLPKIAAKQSTPKKIRKLFRITANWGWAEVSVIFKRGRKILRIRPRAAARFETSYLCRLLS